MKFSSDKAILTGVLLVLVIFTIMVVFSFYQGRQANKTAELVSHTHEVLAQTSRLQSHCTDNESNARGFLISAREDFLDGIEKSKKDINYSIDTLKKLLYDNPEQLKKLEIAASYANRRIAVSDQIANVRKEKNFDEAMQILTGGKGKLYSDSIRAVLQSMDSDENLLLKNRKEANETAMDFQKRIFLAIVILLLLLVVVLFQTARTDLTERIRLEKELKILNEDLETQVKIKSAQLNNIFERVTDAFMAFDLTGNITYANSKAAEVTRKEHKSLLGKNVFEEFPDAKNPIFYNSFHEAVETGENNRYEFEAPDLGIWIEYYLYPSSDGVSCFFRDVTEKKKAEVELIHSERKYKLLFENNPMPMWMVSLQDYSIIDVNEATLQHYGYSRDEFLTLDTRNIRPPEDLGKYVEEYQQRFEGISHRGTWRHKKKDGTIILVEIHAYDFYYEGMAVRLLLVNDITQKQKAEHKLQESHQELRDLAAHLQVIREEERAGIAREIHDELGQQLTGLKMDVSWLSKKLPDANGSIHEKIKDILELLDITVKTVRKISAELRPSILDDLGLIEAMEWHGQEFEKRSGIKVKFHSAIKKITLPENVTIGIFRIFQESLTNVARHAGASEVKCNIEEKNETLLLIIKDDGKGFDPGKVAGKKTLGLLGMKERTLMMGGKYEIKSKKGLGTTVLVNVPFEKIILKNVSL